MDQLILGFHQVQPITKAKQIKIRISGQAGRHIGPNMSGSIVI